ncbi:unnamed protein product [Lota lota]
MKRLQPSETGIFVAMWTYTERSEAVFVIGVQPCDDKQVREDNLGLEGIPSGPSAHAKPLVKAALSPPGPRKEWLYVGRCPIV